MSNAPITNPSSPKPPPDDASPALVHPEDWVDDYGDYLFRFAMGRVRDSVIAEDLVQETFLAALKGASAHEGRASARSWLVGILKHKLYDHFRNAKRETVFADLEFYDDEESFRFVGESRVSGGWEHERGPLEWPDDPGSALDSEVFWKVFQECTRKLPVNVSMVFTLREVDGLEGKEICRMIGISENNLWVILHRARMALRSCLETNWVTKRL